MHLILGIDTVRKYNTFLSSHIGRKSFHIHTVYVFGAKRICPRIMTLYICNECFAQFSRKFIPLEVVVRSIALTDDLSLLRHLNAIDIFNNIHRDILLLVILLFGELGIDQNKRNPIALIIEENSLNIILRFSRKGGRITQKHKYRSVQAVSRRGIFVKILH